MTTDASRLDGRVAFITGGGSGIGRAVAEQFAAAGAAVVVTGRRMEAIGATRKSIEHRGGRGLSVVADVTDLSALESATEEALAVFGRLDIVVANAGGSPRAMAVLDYPPELWLHTLDVNLTGVWNTVKATAPAVIAAGGGAILTMGSGRGRAHTGGLGPYSVAKAGLTALTRVLAAELRPFNVAVNEIIPGPVNTQGAVARRTETEAEQMKWFGREAGTRVSSGDPPWLPAGEWLKMPADVASLALFIVSLPPDGTTGQQFSLAGRLL